MKIVPILLLFFFQTSYAQDQLYRFQFSVSGQSILNYGTRGFDNVSAQTTDFSSVYVVEKYNIDYQNFSFSSGFAFKLSLNWVNNNNYILRQSTSLFFDISDEKINFELVDIGNGDIT